MTVQVSKSSSRFALWFSLGIYLVVLFATGMAGPYWALFLWSLIALPQFWEGAKRNTDGKRAGRLAPSAVVLLIAWLMVVFGWPLLSKVTGWQWEPPTYFEAPLAILVICLPLFITLVLVWWGRAGRRAVG